mgnify:CR=1 FL=1
MDLFDGLMELTSSTVTVLRAFKEFSKKMVQSLRICEGVSGGSERQDIQVGRRENVVGMRGWVLTSVR